MYIRQKCDVYFSLIFVASYQAGLFRQLWTVALM